MQIGRAFRIVAILMLVLCAATSRATAQSPADKAEYARRYKALDAKDADGFAKLGIWCKEKGLETYAGLCLKKALRIDPQNKTANEALGNVLYEGAWTTPEDAAVKEAAKKARADAEIAARAAKEARKKGTLLDPANEEDNARAVSSSFDAGRKDAQELVDAFVASGGFDEARYSGAKTPHVRIVVSASEDEARRLCEIGEFAYRKLSWVTFGTPESKRFEPFGGAMEFMLADDPEMEASIDLVQKRWPALVGHNDFATMSQYVRKNHLEFVDFLDPPVHLHWNPENRPSTVANAVGRAVVGTLLTAKFAEPNLAGGEKQHSMMNWLLEGAGVWASLETVGINDLYRIDGTRYEGDDIVKKAMEIPWCDIAHEIASTGSAEGRASRTFPQLCRSHLRDWYRGDLVQSWAIFDYLVRERQTEYRALVRALAVSGMRQGFLEVFGTEADKTKAVQLVRSNDDRGLMELFEQVGDRFDRAWHDWAVEAYARGGSAYRGFDSAPFRTVSAAPPPADDGKGGKGGKKKGK